GRAPRRRPGRGPPRTPWGPPPWPPPRASRAHPGPRPREREDPARHQGAEQARGEVGHGVRVPDADAVVEERVPGPLADLPEDREHRARAGRRDEHPGAGPPGPGGTRVRDDPRAD